MGREGLKQNGAAGGKPLSAPQILPWTWPSNRNEEWENLGAGRKKKEGDGGSAQGNDWPASLPASTCKTEELTSGSDRQTSAEYRVGKNK